MDHAPFLHRCLALAERGRGHTGINPMVGAVLVSKGKVIAEAWHEQFGGPHAEANLIKKIDHELDLDTGLYLNVEPCCHTKKKTPPCTQVIIKSGIKRVVIGMLDPNPEVAGKGIEELRNGGIEVIGPVERARCEWFNRGFVSLMTKGRPWITLKKAQTLAGQIACEDGSKRKITSAEQDAWSHQYVRAKHDAILVGVGTVVSDDPQLTIRGSREEEAGSSYQPLRVILDPHFRIPLTAKIVNGELAKGTMIITRNSKDSEDSREKIAQFEGRRVRVVDCSADHSGEFVLQDLWKILTTPTADFHGIASILVEGGQKTWEVFRNANVVDADVTLIGKE